MELPQQISKERAKELTEKLKKEGLTTEERNELVEGHIRLAFHLAYKYASISPSYLQTFISEALYSVLIAVEKAKDKVEGDEITQFLIKVIKLRMMRHYYEEQSPFKCGKGWRDKIEKPNKRQQLEDIPIEDPNEKLIELEEMLALCVKNQMEAQLVAMRVQGFNDPEIGEALKVSKQWIHQTRMQIQRRFRKLQGKD